MLIIMIIILISFKSFQARKYLTSHVSTFWETTNIPATHSGVFFPRVTIGKKHDVFA